MQVSVDEAADQFSRLMQLVEEGETVTFVRDGRPVAELAPARPSAGFPPGSAQQMPPASDAHSWWQPVNDSDAEHWFTPPLKNAVPIW